MENQSNNYNFGYSIKRLKEKWKFIFFTLCIFIVLGICCFYYMKKAPVYTAQCTLLYQLDNLHRPQETTCQNNNTINLKEKVSELPIKLFSQIAYSLPFLGEIIDLNINNDSIQNLSPEKSVYISSLKNNFIISINEKDKLITIEATMPSPNGAAELAQKVQQTLRKFAIQWYVQQKQEYINNLEKNYNYILAKCFDIKNKLNSAQKYNTPQSYHEVFNLALEYKSFEKLSIAIAEQLQQIKLDQQNLENYFTIIDPVVQPRSPSNTQKSMVYYMIVFAFLGFIISIYIILIHPVIINLLSYQERHPC